MLLPGDIVELVVSIVGIVGIFIGLPATILGFSFLKARSKNEVRKLELQKEMLELELERQRLEIEYYRDGGQ